MKVVYITIILYIIVYVVYIIYNMVYNYILYMIIIYVPNNVTLHYSPTILSSITVVIHPLYRLGVPPYRRYLSSK